MARYTLSKFIEHKGSTVPASVEVLVLVQQSGGLKTHTPKRKRASGSTTDRLTLLVGDPTKSYQKLTLWGRAATEGAVAMHPGDIVLLWGLQLRSFRGSFELSSAWQHFGYRLVYREGRLEGTVEDQEGLPAILEWAQRCFSALLRPSLMSFRPHAEQTVTLEMLTKSSGITTASSLVTIRGVYITKLVLHSNWQIDPAAPSEVGCCSLRDPKGTEFPLVIWDHSFFYGDGQFLLHTVHSEVKDSFPSELRCKQQRLIEVCHVSLRTTSQADSRLALHTNSKTRVLLITEGGKHHPTCTHLVTENSNRTLGDVPVLAQYTCPKKGNNAQLLTLENVQNLICKERPLDLGKYSNTEIRVRAKIDSILSPAQSALRAVAKNKIEQNTLFQVHHVSQLIHLTKYASSYEYQDLVLLLNDGHHRIAVNADHKIVQKIFLNIPAIYLVPDCIKQNSTLNESNFKSQTSKSYAYENSCFGRFNEIVQNVLKSLTEGCFEKKTWFVLLLSFSDAQRNYTICSNTPMAPHDTSTNQQSQNSHCISNDQVGLFCTHFEVKNSVPVSFCPKK